MTMPTGRAVALAVSLALGLPAFTLAAMKATPRAAEDEALVVHVLNRLGYGPRPGDVERVRAVGLERWIDDQLHPERIPDGGLASHLADLPTVRLSTAELMKRYDIPREAKREIAARRSEMENASEEEMRAARRQFLQKYRRDMDGTPQQVVQELQSAKILRAVYSERQLEEVLVDFWLNHFNVFAGKGPVKFMVGEYERETIRPHAWGKFEDLLRATAESPAMLFYLDNWLSADPNARPMGFARGGQGRKRGLNENYAREIMELHTLGVDGGYTQQDVTEVARCFAGWTLRNLRSREMNSRSLFKLGGAPHPPDPPGSGYPQFFFNERIHDRGEKRVLGHRIPGGGQKEGDEVIHILATHPSTARFISYKLARRFVADEPPKELVDRAAETFRRTGGEIRAVVKTIVTSPEFTSPAARAAKIKSPLEFVVSAVRASGAQVDDARVLAQRIAAMGMPLYQQQPPTGYKDTAEAWVSTSGLLARLNLAVELADGKMRGVSVDPARVISAQTLGSPEFQRR